MSGSDQPGRRAKSPVDQWFEVFVYAPLGFALDARQLYPKFIDRGRNQVVLAKVIGKYAVEHGSKQMGSYLGDSGTQVAAVLQTLGLLPEEDEVNESEDIVEAFEADVVEFGTPRSRKRMNDSDAVVEPVDVGELVVVGSGEPIEPIDSAPAASPPPVADLAIPDYDNLSASQVVPRLEGLSPDELEAVRLYEVAQRGRKTILGKIAQLQSA